MNPVIVLSALLLASLGGNAWLISAWTNAKSTLAATDEAKITATLAAQACDAAVNSLQKAAQNQIKAAEETLSKANAQARLASSKAMADRQREPAVPGDACTSAQIETRQWLLRRRNAQ